MAEPPTLVRPATAGNASALARLLHDFNLEYEEPSPGPEVLENRVRSFIVDGVKEYLVAEDGSGIRGFSQFDFHASIWSEGPVLFLDELCVMPDHRGNGMGRLMMDSMRAAAEVRGAAGMEVVTGEVDIAARGLYESFGFQNRIEGSQNARSLFYELSFGE